MDFFTPIVDDPFTYGQIAAANALSDVYAMGGQPLTVLNIACFSLDLAPSETWAAVLAGMDDKTREARAVCVGGHTVEDTQPKFGMAVTGLIDPDRVWANTGAEVGDEIWLSKPIGTGIINTAAKLDLASDDQLMACIESMATLNSSARDAAMASKTPVRCATDITGFGLAGHLFNVARASNVTLELEANSIPQFPGLQALVERGCVTGGGSRNRDYLGDNLEVSADLPSWLTDVFVDPQTSGGLAVFSRTPIAGSVRIGRVVEGSPKIRVF